jgi:hypothetical protein
MKSSTSEKFIQIIRYMFRSYDHLQVEIHIGKFIYFRLKMVVRPKHVADNFNKIVNNIEIELG